EVADRDEPEIAAGRAVVEAPDGDAPRHRESRRESHAGERRSGRAGAGGDEHEGRGDPLGEDQAGVAAPPRGARAAVPAQLVVDEVAEAPRPEAMLDDAAREHDPVSGAGRTIAEVVVVGEAVAEGLEAAAGVEDRTPDQDARPHAKRHALDRP